MTVICNIYNSVKNLLPHFYKHYMAYGITYFLFGIHEGSQNPVWNEIIKLSPSSSTTTLVESYRGPIHGSKEGESLNKLREAAGGLWVIPTDLDEFHVPGHFKTFSDLAMACDSEQAVYVHSILQDQICDNGIIPLHIFPDITIEKQFPLYYNITGKILGACEKKVCLSRQHLPLNNGHHYLGCNSDSDLFHKCFSQQMITRHYKWFGNLYEKETEKWNEYSKCGLSYATENERLLRHLQQHNGNLL